LVTLKVALLRPNVAVTTWTALIDDSVQLLPLVLVHPAQLLKSESAPGFAVKVTLDPLSCETTQVGPAQLIPVPVTVPLPLICIVTAYFFNVKVAVTGVAALIDVTLQTAPAADVQPDQPPKSYSAAGWAVRATLLPESSETLHGNVVQLIPPPPVTVPDPLA